SFGDDMNRLDEYAWYQSNTGGKTHPVGQKKPNAYGLYDMYGNVTEWMQDCYRNSYVGAPTDGSAVTGPSDCPHVLRGQSWFNRAQQVRTSNRNSDGLDDRFFDRGFRLAESLR